MTPKVPSLFPVASRPPLLAPVKTDPYTGATRYIRRQASFKLTVTDIAQRTGLGRARLEREFRSHSGCSLTTAIRRIVLNRVRSLLSATDLPLKAIANETGFNHVEYLSVFFKREVGETPGHYRARLRSAKRVTRQIKPAVELQA